MPRFAWKSDRVYTIAGVCGCVTYPLFVLLIYEAIICCCNYNSVLRIPMAYMQYCTNDYNLFTNLLFASLFWVPIQKTGSFGRQYKPRITPTFYAITLGR